VHDAGSDHGAADPFGGGVQARGVRSVAGSRRCRWGPASRFRRPALIPTARPRTSQTDAHVRPCRRNP
jgi:hypothetical protein